MSFNTSCTLFSDLKCKKNYEPSGSIHFVKTLHYKSLSHFSVAVFMSFVFFNIEFSSVTLSSVYHRTSCLFQLMSENKIR